MRYPGTSTGTGTAATAATIATVFRSSSVGRIGNGLVSALVNRRRRCGSGGFSRASGAGDQLPAQTSRKRRSQLPPMIFSIRRGVQPRRSIASVRLG